MSEKKQLFSGLFSDAFWEYFCSQNAENFFFFFGIFRICGMKKAEVPFRYPSCHVLML